MQKRKDDLDARRTKRQGIEELHEGLQQACSQYDKMADDLERQVYAIEEITQKVNQAIDDRKTALDE